MYNEEVKTKFDALKTASRITVLGIESSCDETAAAVAVNGKEMLTNVISSQIAVHRKYGGVVPEIASRNHLLNINSVIKEALSGARIALADIDAIAVTVGPGLAGALLVGVSTAKALSYAIKKPLIKVNHIEAHIAANSIAYPDLKPPFLAVAASGGHTGIIKVNDYNDYAYLGGTVDDAIGEAFDKVARLLGLPYPGGPEVDKLSRLGVPNIDFFKHKRGVKTDLRLSYSGLKTAVVNYLNSAKMRGETVNAADVCASFTKAAADMLVDASMYTARLNGFKTIVLAGGVAANSYLRENLTKEAAKFGIEVFIPPSSLCGDNAAMVAARAYYSIKAGTGLAELALNIDSGLGVGR